MNEPFSIIVQKFGGSSVADPEKVKAVAGFIKKQLTNNTKALIVVSAMGKTTNDLLNLAKHISPNPKKREQDMLVSCGERISMALLAMALNDLNVKSISLTGSQSGIITDNNHGGANIIAIRPGRVLDSFLNYQIVIIAGFQGVSQDKEVTTLKRGGSDTTAVAMAAALNAKHCEIYTDVDGVMSADPQIVKDAVLLPKVSFAELENMSLYGAKVMAHDAAVMAKQHNVELKVARSLSEHEGTFIGPCSSFVFQQVISITHCADIARFKTSQNNFLHNVKNEEQIFCASLRQESVVGYLKSAAINDTFNCSSCIVFDYGYALVVLHTSELRPKNIMAKVINFMKINGFFVVDLWQQDQKIFITINQEQLADVIKLLHQSFILGVENEQKNTQSSVFI